jgi:hypothetical protein
LNPEQRRHPRYGVHLAVRYTNAEQFVTDYVENLSVNGLFIAGAHRMPLFTETQVDVELPGQGTWNVRAKSVFVIDEEAAKQSGRRAGAGMSIIEKPPGFDDALLGYLLRLGKRRDHTVMVGEVPGARHITDAGFRVVALAAPELAAAEVTHEDFKLLAIVVPPERAQVYRAAVGDRGRELVYAVTREEDVHDILARIDSLL